jgi:hypothetical protein
MIRNIYNETDQKFNQNSQGIQSAITSQINSKGKIEKSQNKVN